MREKLEDNNVYFYYKDDIKKSISVFFKNTDFTVSFLIFGLKLKKTLLKDLIWLDVEDPSWMEGIWTAFA